MHPEVSASGHSDAEFLDFLRCLREWLYDSRDSQSLLHVSHAELLKYINRKTPCFKYKNRSNYQTMHFNTKNIYRHSMDLIQATTLTILTSSFTFQFWYYSYQKDERANPGDLRTNRYSSSPPNIEVSLSFSLSTSLSGIYSLQGRHL